MTVPAAARIVVATCPHHHLSVAKPNIPSATPPRPYQLERKMTSDEEARLWQAEMASNRIRYAKWLKHDGRGRGHPLPDSPAIVRSKELIGQAREIVATAKELRSRNR